jgi:hypothetical protein
MLTKGPQTINHPADDDCTNEGPDNCEDPPVLQKIACTDAKQSTDYSRDL